MNIEEYRNYCLSKKGVTEEFPFDENALVFKVMGKMFALSSLKSWEEGNSSLNLKCDPDWAMELRGQYESINPGFHMNKKHWNTIHINNGELPDNFIRELIDHSYILVVNSLTRKLKEDLSKK
jgi:predicted DNA-binding protein (MmcQ/YjbR family)